MLVAASAAPFLPLRTERLTLRAHREADLADVIARDSGASVKARSIPLQD